MSGLSKNRFWKQLTVRMVSESSQPVNEWVVMLQRRVEQTSLLFSSLHTKRPKFLQLWHFNPCGWKVLFGTCSLMPFGFCCDQERYPIQFVNSICRKSGICLTWKIGNINMLRIHSMRNIQKISATAFKSVISIYSQKCCH